MIPILICFLENFKKIKLPVIILKKVYVSRLKNEIILKGVNFEDDVSVETIYIAVVFCFGSMNYIIQKHLSIV